MEVIRFLRKEKADLEAEDHSGRTPLHVAALAGQAHCVSFLLREGARIDHCDKNDNSPLHCAALAGGVKCVVVLLRKGARVNALAKDKSTPLHYAVGKGHLKCAEELIRAGADVNARDEHIQTPLHVAAAKDHISCVQLLLRKGSDKDLADIDNKLPKDLAKRRQTIALLGSSDRARIKIVTSGHHLSSGGRRDRHHRHRASHRRTSNGNRHRLGDKSRKQVSNVYSSGHNHRDGVRHSTGGSRDRRRDHITLSGSGGRRQNGHHSTRMSASSGSTKLRADHDRVRSSNGDSSKLQSRLSGVSSPKHSGKKHQVPLKRHSTGSAIQTADLEADLKKIAELDRFGFRKMATSMAITNQTQKEAERALKWAKMLKDKENWDSPKMAKKRRERVLKGIPDCVRGEAWMALAKIGEIRAANGDSNTYKNLLKQKIPTEYDELIKKDESRTYPEHIYFQTKQGKRALTNVCRASAVFRPKAGYCQGMAGMIGILLMYMQEEEAFWIFHKISTDFQWEEFHREGFPGLIRGQAILDNLLATYLPDLWQHMTDQQVISSMYTIKWFLTATTFNLCHCFPLAIRFWDILLCDGQNAIYIFILAIFKVLNPKLLSLPFETLVPCLLQPQDPQNPKFTCDKIMKVYQQLSKKGIVHKITQFGADYEAQYHGEE